MKSGLATGRRRDGSEFPLEVNLSYVKTENGVLMISSITDITERLATHALTRQLLVFSRTKIIETTTLDLNQVIVDMEKMLRRLIGEDIELSTALSPERRALLHPEAKIMYMSAHTDKTVSQHGVVRPVTAFLQKPFTKNALLLRVREVSGAD